MHGARSELESLLSPVQNNPVQTKPLHIWRIVPLFFCAYFLTLQTACGIRKSDSGDARRTVYDDLGRPVLVVDKPARIVSLAPSVTEMLFAIGAGNRVIGDTTYCDYPPEAKEITKIGDTEHPSLERIISLKPDLVVGSTASELEQFEERLSALKIPVYTCQSGSLSGLLESIRKLGDVTGSTTAAQGLADSLKARIDNVRQRVSGLSRPRVLIVINSDPLMTAGGHTFLTDLITAAGGQSITADQESDYPRFSLETAVAREPEVILLQAGGAPLPDQLQSTPAVRSGKVFHIDDAVLLRPGPRIVDGLEQIARKLHPEAFGASENTAAGASASNVLSKSGRNPGESQP